MMLREALRGLSPLVIDLAGSSGGCMLSVLTVFKELMKRESDPI